MSWLGAIVILAICPPVLLLWNEIWEDFKSERSVGKSVLRATASVASAYAFGAIFVAFCILVIYMVLVGLGLPLS